MAAELIEVLATSWAGIKGFTRGNPGYNMRASGGLPGPMARWIAFDDDTAEAVVCRFRRGAAEIRKGDALDAVLAQPGKSLLLMPAESPGQLLVVTVANSKSRPFPKPKPEPVSVPRWWAQSTE